MKAHMRKLLKIFTSRVVVVGLALLVQLSWYLLFLNRLANYSIVVNGFFRVLSVIILLYLIRKDENSAYKIAWMILIMVIPLLGGILYVMIGNKKPGKKLAAKMAVVKDSMTDALKQNEDVLQEIEEQDAGLPEISGILEIMAPIRRGKIRQLNIFRWVKRCLMPC